jgi:iron complex outermembrane receptor protein
VAPPDQTAPAPSGSGPLSDAGERPAETGYIVQNAVSATKTNTPIRETPVSVQVVPKAVLEDRQVTDLDEPVTNGRQLERPHNPRLQQYRQFPEQHPLS